MAERLGMELAFGEGNNAYHVSWLSRRRIIYRHNHRLPGLSKTLLEIHVPYGRGQVRLYATHFGSRHDRAQPAEEAAVVLDVLRESDDPHLLTGDLNALHPLDTTGEPPALERLRRVEDTAGGQRGALTGLVERGYVDCYRALHRRAGGYTFRTSHPWLRLDYILASPDLAVGLTRCRAERDSDWGVGPLPGVGALRGGRPGGGGAGS